VVQVQTLAFSFSFRSAKVKLPVVAV